MRNSLYMLYIFLAMSIPATVFAQNNPAAHNQLATAHQSYLDGNIEGALTLYQQIKAEKPANVPSYYYSACALAELGRYTEAKDMIHAALSVEAGKNESLHAKLLFVLAVFTEMHGDLTLAQRAWNNYLEYAKKHGNAVTYIASASARLKMINKKITLDQQYVAVRKRIETSK